VKKFIDVVFIGSDGKLSMTALFAVFSFIILVTLYIQGLILRWDIASAWLDWSILVVEVAVIGRAGQRALIGIGDSIASVRRPAEKKELIKKQEPQPKVKQTVKEKTATVEPKKTPTIAVTNFSISEFDSKDGAKMSASVRKNIEELMRIMEVVREACGNREIIITSGYRSAQHNTNVGGAKNSYHVKGMAADFKVKGMTPKKVYAIVNDLMDSGKIPQGGIGLYKSWVHLDFRGKKVTWTG
jgi:hypothetical protein